MNSAMRTFTKMGLNPVKVNEAKITFEFKGKPISYWPYSGWASGESIVDGRGIKTLLNQLKNK